MADSLPYKARRSRTAPGCWWVTATDGRAWQVRPTGRGLEYRLVYLSGPPVDMLTDIHIATAIAVATPTAPGGDAGGPAR